MTFLNPIVQHSFDFLQLQPWPSSTNHHPGLSIANDDDGGWRSWCVSSPRYVFFTPFFLYQLFTTRLRVWNVKRQQGTTIIITATNTWNVEQGLEPQVCVLFFFFFFFCTTNYLWLDYAHGTGDANDKATTTTTNTRSDKWYIYIFATNYYLCTE